MQIIGPTNPIVPKKLIAPGGAGSTGAGTTAATDDPFAQTTNAQIAALVNKYVSGLPAAQTPAQITAGAQAQIQPQIGKLTAAITGQQKTADNAITGATQGLTNYLSGIDYTAPYSGAQDRQAAIDSALQSSLNGDSGASAAQLAQNWQSIGEPSASDPAVAALNTQGTGLANAALATGSASLSNLNADQAANEAYGLKQPGIAKTAGIQQLGQAAATAQGNLATGTQSIESELPNILSGLQSASDTAKTNRANLGEQIWETATGQNVTKGTAKAGFDSDVVSATTPQRFSSGGAEFSFDPTTGQITQLTSSSPVTVSPGTTLVDPSTGQPLYTAPPKTTAPKPGAGTAATGGLTSSEWRSLVSSTTSKITAAAKSKSPTQRYVTVTNPDGSKTSKFVAVPGTGNDATPYSEALATAIQQGPQTTAWKTKATQIVNAQYPQGENGRPYTGPSAVTAAKQFVAQGIKRGYTAAQTLKAGEATGVLPPDVLASTVTKAYKNSAGAKLASSLFATPLGSATAAPGN